MSRIAAKTYETYLSYLTNTYTEVLYYSMEPPFWHRYVIMAAKIVSKPGILLTMWVSAHRFTVTSPCLCGTFPKFGDLFSHRVRTVCRPNTLATDFNRLQLTKSSLNRLIYCTTCREGTGCQVVKRNCGAIVNERWIMTEHWWYDNQSK